MNLPDKYGALDEGSETSYRAFGPSSPSSSLEGESAVAADAKGEVSGGEGAALLGLGGGGVGGVTVESMIHRRLGTSRLFGDSGLFAFLGPDQEKRRARLRRAAIDVSHT